MAGTLFVVATPIGNLEDLTLRASQTLKNVDAILCEDTRVTAKLLHRFEIKKPLLSYFHHSPEKKIREILNLLRQGKQLALVTDAGTPGISDPGNQLIERIEQTFQGEVPIIPIPGPSAVTAALSISGFPTDRFLFLGFIPLKKHRMEFLTRIAGARETTVFFESGHRIEKTLKELQELLGEHRRIVVCRELTKMFGTTYRGTIADVLKELMNTKGEFTIVIAP